MRFPAFINDIVVPVSVAQKRQMQNFAEKIEGGWEVWLQVEIYWFLVTETSGVLTFRREPQYPNSWNPFRSKKRADFNFVPRTSQNVTIWVELKTQRANNILRAAEEFCDDVNKLHEDFPNDATNYPGAIVVVPNGNSKLILDVFHQSVMNRLGPDWPHHISYQVVTPGGIAHGKLNEQYQFPKDRQDPVILSYVKP